MRGVIGLLAGFMLFFTHAAKADGIDALTRFYERVDSLTADFRQVQTDEEGNVLQEAAGRFWLDRPERFRWEYERPYSQIIVSDGEAFRFYDVDLAQVTVRPVGQTLRATPAVLLAGGAALGEAFEVADVGSEDGLDWVRLVPRADDSDFRRIRIGLADGLVRRMRLHDQLGQTTRITFDNIEINRELTGDRFTLELPDGVEVVDARESAG